MFERKYFHLAPLLNDDVTPLTNGLCPCSVFLKRLKITHHSKKTDHK